MWSKRVQATVAGVSVERNNPAAKGRIMRRRLLASAVATVLAAPLSIGAFDAADAAGSAVRFAAVQYDSPGSDSGSNSSLNAEWAKITNYSSQTKSLSGWTVRDPAGHVYRFGSFSLRPGTSVRLHTGSGSNSRTDVYWRSGAYVWNNTGDKAILRNGSGTLVDSCSWSDGDGNTSC